MARSPLRAGVGCANPASQPQFYRPRPYGRGYEHLHAVAVVL